MHLRICALTVIFSFSFAAGQNSSCITPNGENGTCIAVNSCRPIKQAIMYLDPDGIEFARNSQCGYNDGPLVCCGSVGRVTLPASLTEPTTLPTIQVYIPSVATPIDNFFLPDRSLCGLQIPENRTPVGTTEITEFPWVVALKYTKDDGTPGGFKCSGTLINTRYVLTAAQCLNIPGFILTEVRLGDWRFTSSKDCINSTESEEPCKDPVIDLKVIEKTAHPYFNNKSGNNDIAVIRLEKKVKYNDYVRPICLPPSDFLPPPAGTGMEISGWGLTKNGLQSDVKLKNELSMVAAEECNKVYPNYIQIYPNKACVSVQEGKNLCNGESGGPLMRTYEKEDETDQEQWFQEGIIYKGIGCGDKSTPGLYMRVSRYINWILSNLKQS